MEMAGHHLWHRYLIRKMIKGNQLPKYFSLVAQSESREPCLSSAALTLIFAAVVVTMPAAKLFDQPASYIPLHTILEFISIAISVMVFSLCWNIRKEPMAGKLPAIGGVFLSVAVIDMLHTLSYEGMPPLVTPASVEKAIGFWLYARIISILGLLVFAFSRQQVSAGYAEKSLLLNLLVSAGIAYIGLYHQDLMPRTFVPNAGLTAFKIRMEYGLAFLYLVAAWKFWQRSKEDTQASFGWLAAACWVLALSGIFFTLYQNASDLMNVMGHIYKSIGYLIVYRAIFVVGVHYPYKKFAATLASQHERELFYKTLASVNPVGIFRSDKEGNYIYANANWSKIAGLPVNQALDSGWKQGIYPADRLRVEQQWNTAVSQARPFSLEYRFKKPNGEIAWVYGQTAAIKNETDEILGYVGTITDITRRKATEEEIHRLAYYDSLTQLPNRSMMIDRISQSLASRQRNKIYGAILFIDLDNFKQINATRGHTVGDRLLIEVGNRLRSCVRASDSVARLGGDEFVVLLEDLGQNHEQAAMKAGKTAERILEALNSPYQLAEQEYIGSSCIGISLFIDGNETPEDLLRRSDTAMYRAKSNGRNILCFFEPAMQKALEEHATLESWMRTALREHEFRLYYQVQVDHNRQPIGAEALIRWKHPIQGFIYTPDFINVAEESELIVAIGQWVLETGCAQIKAWESNPAMRSLSLSINVSARQFGRPDFVETIKAVIARSAIASEKLKLEMTEGLLIHDVDDTVAKMTQLKSIGVQFSMDDFGTGHSSLNYLKRLPLSQLKIDQSFVRDITVDANDAAIVKTIIRMGQTLQMNVIAEGVETEEQLRFLKENGCTVFQGYLFGKPLPLEEFERLIASCNERRLVDRKSNAPG